MEMMLSGYSLPLVPASTKAHGSNRYHRYNVLALVEALDSEDDGVATAAQRALSKTLLVFDYLYVLSRVSFLILCVQYSRLHMAHFAL